MKHETPVFDLKDSSSDFINDAGTQWLPIFVSQEAIEPFIYTLSAPNFKGADNVFESY